MSNTYKTYFTLLEDIVGKKEILLSQMILDTLKQQSCFTAESFNEALFEEMYEHKMKLLQEIDKLDDGFLKMYEHVKLEMQQNRSAYEEQIKSLQGRIRKITEEGVRLKQLETENRRRFDGMLVTQKKRVKEYKVSKRSASAYYKSMMKLNTNDAVFYNRTN